MRRLAARSLGATLVAWVLAACANPEPPAGGPLLNQPPKLLATRPDTFARVPAYRGPVVFVFDAPISDPLTGQTLREAVDISPRTSTPDVRADGDEVRISLSRGWEPNRVYRIVLDRTVRDRFGNALGMDRELVFSTGAPIVDTRLAGTATDQITGRPLVAGRVEAISVPDSLVYSVRSDSAGGFAFRYLPPGRYRVRAFADANRDRALQPFEARDTALVTVAAGTRGDSAALRFSLLVPDTTAPKPTTARATGDVVTIGFDDYLDPAQPISAIRVQVVDSAAGAAVPVRELRVGQIDTVRAAPPARQDTAPRPDSAGVAAPSVRDTVVLPQRTLSVRTAVALRAGTAYRVIVAGVRNVNGIVGGGDVALRTANPPPVRTPARTAPADSAPGTPPARTAPTQPPAGAKP